MSCFVCPSFNTCFAVLRVEMNGRCVRLSVPGVVV